MVAHYRPSSTAHTTVWPTTMSTISGSGAFPPHVDERAFGQSAQPRLLVTSDVGYGHLNSPA